MSWWLTSALLINNVLSNWRWGSSSISENIVFELFSSTFFIINMKRENVSNMCIRLLKLFVSYWVNSSETYFLEFVNFVFQVIAFIGIDNLLSFWSLFNLWLCPYFNSLYCLCLLFLFDQFFQDLSVLLGFFFFSQRTNFSCVNLL